MIDVTCAVIRNEEEEVLIVQRGERTDHPFKWEFPGGKLNNEESEDECVIREIREELSMDIVILRRLDEVVHDYGHKKIRLIPFVCDTLDDLPFLTEHIAYRWVKATDLKTVDFSEADVFVAENYLGTVIKERKADSEKRSVTDIPGDAELQAMINRMIGMKEADWLATSAIENSAIFLKLLEYSYSQDQKLAFHASWTLTKVCDKYPEIIIPYLPQITETLYKIGNESTLRSFLRIISLSDLNMLSQHHHGLLTELCFNKLNSGFSAIAIKAYSMEILYRMYRIYPDLAGELSVSIRNTMDTESAGLISKGRTILKKLDMH
jgi:8-oxo-dGTP diphosphatase